MELGYVHRNNELTFAYTKKASIRNNINQRRYAMISFTSQHHMEYILQKVKGQDMYETADTKTQYIKPHCDVDFDWEEIDHNVRDEIIAKVSDFMQYVFNTEPKHICVLYDEKSHRCSLHINIANVYTTASELIKLKNKYKSALADTFEFDNTIYKNGETKFRCAYAIKAGSKSGGLIPYENKALGIQKHNFFDYMVYHGTNSQMKPWRFDSVNCKEMEAKFNITAEKPKVVRKIKGKSKKPKTPKNDILSDIKVDPKEAEALDSLIKYACEQKNIKFHTHEIITLSSKGLVNSGFIAQGKQLVLNSMNNKNKDLNAIWMDCRNNAYKTQRKNATFYYYFKQVFGNDTFYNIINKFQEHHLVQSLYDDLYTVQSNNINEIHERYIPESVIDTIKDNKITFLKSHLGTGKTTIMKKIIKDHPGASILYLAPRIAFGKQIHSELDNFTFYGDLKKTSKPDMKQRIIIQMESLHKIQGIKYDIVVCDEIESCLKQLSSTETMKHNIMKNHDIFEKAILNAKRVICCDAFLSNKTIQVMNSINNLSQFNGNNTTATIINTFNPYKRKSFEFQNEKKLLAELWRKLNNGKRVVFVCGSKSKAQTINDLFIKKYKDSKTSMFYYGSMSEQDKDFSNVEQTWSKLDLLIYTPVITCGVNYDPKIPTFDCLFMYATASSACIRDVFQSSLRVRKLNENHLLYVINPTSKQKNEFVFGLSENIMKVQELANFVLSKTELYTYTESKPWVRLNYAHNLNEEGINKHFYTQTFRDMLKICGYEDKICTTDNNKENKIDSTFTPLKDVEEIDELMYDELKRNPYSLTEDEKLSMTHFECSKVFKIDDEVWERVSRNTAILANVTYEFKYKQKKILALANDETNNVNEIYAKNLAEKTIAIKELNEIMGFKDSYNICYETKFVKNNQKKIQAYLEKYQQLWNLRTTQGKDWFRYANSKIKQIYMKWNGCEIKADQNKNKIKDKVKKNRKSSYTYKLVGPLNSSVMI